MPISLILSIVSLVMFLAVIIRFGKEGLAAAYLVGVPLFIFITRLAGLRFPTLATGIYSAAVGGLVCILYFFTRPSVTEYVISRRMTLSWMGLVILSIVWFVHHVVERQIAPMTVTAAEYFKWGYGIVYWMLALVVGIMFPVSYSRVQRLCRAIGWVALITIGVQLASYFLGLKDVSEAWGYRYSSVGRVSALSYAIIASIGSAGLLAGYGYAQPARPGLRKTLLLVIGIGILFAGTILGGTRSAAACIILTVVLFLGTFRLRYIPIGLTVLVMVGALFIFVIVPLLPGLAAGRVLKLESIVEGLSTRFDLAVSAFKILTDSPILGKTLFLRSVIGMEYSHNFTLQVLVETGIFGFVLLAAVMVKLVMNYGRAMAKTDRSLNPIVVPLMIVFFAAYFEAHAHEHLFNNRVWMLIGLFVSHPVYRTAPVVYNEYDLWNQRRAMQALA